MGNRSPWLTARRCACAWKTTSATSTPKCIRTSEFVASFDKIADGKGGYWPDQGYDWYAGI